MEDRKSGNQTRPADSTDGLTASHVLFPRGTILDVDLEGLIDLFHGE
jgi:hypothetical protein